MEGKIEIGGENQKNKNRKVNMNLAPPSTLPHVPF